MKVDVTVLRIIVGLGGLVTAGLCLEASAIAAPLVALPSTASGTAIVHQSVIDKFNAGEPTVDVIVILNGNDNYVGQINADLPEKMRAQQGQIRSANDAVLARIGAANLHVKHRFENIMGFSGRINRYALDALSAMSEIQSIEEDAIVEGQDIQGVDVMNATRVPLAYNGSGVSIAITDTGINYNHSMLGGAPFPNSKVIGGYDLADNDANPIDCHSHGTSVAGIAAGAEGINGDYVGGVATGAKLYALKTATGCGNYHEFSTIVAAWDWAVSHKYDNAANPILVINTSIAGYMYRDFCDSALFALDAAARNAEANGITIVVASGNDGFTDALGAPACLSTVVSVGAVYDANVGYQGFANCADATTYANKVTCYSNSASFLSVLAPSTNAWTTHSNLSYWSFGGTSAAAPYVAGAVALIQGYAKATLGRYLTVKEVKTRLIEYGDPVTDTKSGLTTPRINLLDSFVSSAFDLSCAHLPVQNAGTGHYFSTIQEAYNSATTGAVIQVLYGNYYETLAFNRDISVTINGGYDCGFPARLLGNSTIRGAVSATLGTFTLNNFSMQ